jgi:hypothetical protein
LLVLSEEFRDFDETIGCAGLTFFDAFVAAIANLRVDAIAPEVRFDGFDRACQLACRALYAKFGISDMLQHFRY